MAEFNLDNIATDLNDKIGKGECVRYPVSKWQSSDGLSWYTIYNDGWKECGGKIKASSSKYTLNLPLPSGFSDKNYTAVVSANFAEGSSSFWWVFEHSRTEKTLLLWTGYDGIGGSGGALSSNTTINFHCEGY